MKLKSVRPETIAIILGTIFFSLVIVSCCFPQFFSEEIGTPAQVQELKN